MAQGSILRTYATARSTVRSSARPATRTLYADSHFLRLLILLYNPQSRAGEGPKFGPRRRVPVPPAVLRRELLGALDLSCPGIC